MSIQSLMRQSCLIYPITGYNKFGRDTSGAGVTSICRFQNQTKTKILPDQTIIQLVGVVYLPGETVVATENRIVISGVSYKAFSVNGAIDGRGRERMIKVEVQKWQTT